MHACIHTYVSILCIYIYIYRERERCMYILMYNNIMERPRSTLADANRLLMAAMRPLPALEIHKFQTKYKVWFV